MILLIIGLFAVAAICLSAQHWLYKKIKVKCLIGQIVYNCPNSFIIYDFSNFEEKGIVAVQIGTQDQKNTITKDIYISLRDKGYSQEMIELIKEEYEFDDKLETFYVQNAVIPYNKLKKRYEKWEGELHVWDL